MGWGENRGIDIHSIVDGVAALDRMEISYRFSSKSQERQNPYPMRSLPLFYHGFSHSESKKAIKTMLHKPAINLV
jgi:hypothetical protein